MKLYDLELSGNCYKVRLFASLAEIPLTIVPVDFMQGEHKEKHILDLNPWGEIPILEDGKVVLRDAQAILVYLASKFGGEAWWPSEPHLKADVMQWLSVAANEIQHGPNTARLIEKFNIQSDMALCAQRSERILELINNHLLNNDWLAAGRPTIADCAVYPYVSLAHEGNITMIKYTNITAWMDRIEQLPGYISMPGN
ncbi:glutathione S-transferase [Aliiglaciecola sp. 3_MG-2023]|uniref:glutathione S-transferase family protein n=1 Tax=Aliiglaciecola TaxID=1406885 RepID=UPI001C0A26F6|nr:MULTISPECIES: glutathione S-transferase [Aliiglaciecola]MBU2878363.1 glutathione S-transferase [Aliiglaciecola lipolytica]MDO6694650.1 glutathione S-transferase [Aliiglaciecola sp. 3_MG-2023]